MQKIAVISGSVFGTAIFYAQNIVEQLKQAGFEVEHLNDADLVQVLACNPDFYIFISSTTGMGELPSGLMPLYQELRDNLPLNLRGKDCAVIGLGDCCYDDFCNSAVLLSELVLELGMQELVPALKLDASEGSSKGMQLVEDLIAEIIVKLS